MFRNIRLSRISAIAHDTPNGGHALLAAAAVFAKVAIPEMLRAKYDKQLAAGVCAAGATLDSLIPPSTLLVVYGIVTEQSIGTLLVAGFVPGIVSAFVYAAIITWRCWRQPELGPRITGYTWPQRFQSSYVSQSLKTTYSPARAFT